MSGPEPKFQAVCALPMEVYDREGGRLWLPAECHLVPTDATKKPPLHLALALDDEQTPGIVTADELTQDYGAPEWNINRSESCEWRQNPPFMQLARLFTDELTSTCWMSCLQHDKQGNHDAEEFRKFATNPLILTNLSDPQIEAIKAMAVDISEHGYDNTIRGKGNAIVSGINHFLQTQGANPNANECPIVTEVTYIPKVPHLRIPSSLNNAVENWSAVFQTPKTAAVYALRNSKKGMETFEPNPRNPHSTKMGHLAALNRGRRGETFTYSSGKYEEMSGSAQLFSMWQPQLEGIFEKAGLPGWMSVLPIIESRMIASAGAGKAAEGHSAVGYYQFLPNVAGDFGLKTTAEVDERMNIIFAAQAAAAKIAREKAMILKPNFVPGLEISDYWANLLVIAAFHTGTGNLHAALLLAHKALLDTRKQAKIENVVEKMYTTDFKAAGFGEDSRDYLPQFFVAMNMVYRELAPDLRLSSQKIAIVSLTATEDIPWHDLAVDGAMGSSVLNNQFGTLDSNGDQHTENTYLRGRSRFLIPLYAAEDLKNWLDQNGYATRENVMIEAVPVSTEGTTTARIAP